jgi:hypothetical protein
MGYVAQLFVKAEPFGGDPRAVTGTHTLYTLDELKAMSSDKDRVDAYYNKRADLHDVLEATVQTRDVKAAYPKLEGKQELLLLKKAIEQFYPAAAAPAPAPVEVVKETPPAIPVANPAPAPAPSAPPAEAPVEQGGSIKLIQMGGGGDSNSNSGQTIQVAVGSTDAPHLQSAGGVQPQGYLLGHARIGVGQ